MKKENTKNTGRIFNDVFTVFLGMIAAFVTILFLSVVFMKKTTPQRIVKEELKKKFDNYELVSFTNITDSFPEMNKEEHQYFYYAYVEVKVNDSLQTFFCTIYCDESTKIWSKFCGNIYKDICKKPEIFHPEFQKVDFEFVSEESLWALDRSR